ncbi:MAG: diguanylate cyclase [Steroidobacteraceae bacterium]
MSAPDTTLLAEVLLHSPDGVAVVSGEGGTLRVVYANSTLAALLRLAEASVVGRTLLEIETEAATDPNATVSGSALRVQLRRADGTLLPCERWTVMLGDGRLAMHYRPFQRSGAAPSVDRASGLATPEHLFDTLRRDWSVGQRDGRRLTVMRFDVDASRDYHEVFGRVATENVLRQVGRTIASAMRRTSDVVARTGDDEFVAYGLSMEQGSACAYAESILARVRSLAIHHPRSRTGRYLTVSAGVATSVPPRDRDHAALLEAAHRALKAAKEAGGNRVVGGEI